MSVVFEKTSYLTDKPFHYCPGCNHGIIHRLVAEALEESGMGGNIVGVAPVGCSVFAYDYFNVDMLEAAHGRAPAVATGVKRAKPDSLVFTYQGDGDLASIGTAEIVHAAHRGEKIVTIFVNNAIYGMTGGQMAPPPWWVSGPPPPPTAVTRPGAARPSRCPKCCPRCPALTTLSAAPSTTTPTSSRPRRRSRRHSSTRWKARASA